MPWDPHPEASKPMPNYAPQRRENPAHLDPPGVRLERALLARADELEKNSPTDAGIWSQIAAFQAAEWRKLAEELHYW